MVNWCQAGGGGGARFGIGMGSHASLRQSPVERDLPACLSANIWVRCMAILSTRAPVRARAGEGREFCGAGAIGAFQEHGSALGIHTHTHKPVWRQTFGTCFVSARLRSACFFVRLRMAARLCGLARISAHPGLRWGPACSTSSCVFKRLRVLRARPYGRAPKRQRALASAESGATLGRKKLVGAWCGLAPATGFRAKSGLVAAPSGARR